MRRPIGLFIRVFVCLISSRAAAAAADNATITGDGVRMRWESRTDAEIITTLNKGTRVEVINRSQVYQTIGGDSAFWYYVTYGKDSGFVFGRFIAIDPAAAPSFEPVMLPGGPSLPVRGLGGVPHGVLRLPGVERGKGDGRQDRPVRHGPGGLYREARASG